MSTLTERTVISVAEGLCRRTPAERAMERVADDLPAEAVVRCGNQYRFDFASGTSITMIFHGESATLELIETPPSNGDGTRLDVL